MSDIKGLCTVIGCFVSHVGITSKPLTSFTLYVLLQNCAEKFVQVLCYIFLIMTVLYSRNIFELHWDLFWWCLSCYIFPVLWCGLCTWCPWGTLHKLFYVSSQLDDQIIFLVIFLQVCLNCYFLLQKQFSSSFSYFLFFFIVDLSAHIF